MIVELIKILFWRPFRAAVTRLPPLRWLTRRAGHAGLIPLRVLKLLYIFRPLEFTVCGDNPFRYRYVEGDLVGLLLYWRGAAGYEPATVARFASWIRQVEHFADVGANTGQYSLIALASNPRVQVHAFEAVPRLVERLEQNLRINGWSERVQVAQHAVGARHGETVSFHVPDVPVPSSGSLDPQGFDGLAGECIEAQAVRLDRYFEGREAPGLVKIDVEGFEHAVLEGMSDLFAAKQRPALIVECLPDSPLERTSAILQEQGYTLFHITDRGCVRQTSITREQASLEFKNWLALPPGSPLLETIDAV